MLVKNSLLIFPFKRNISPIRDSRIFQEYFQFLRGKFWDDLEITQKGEAATSSECDVTQGFEAAILNEYDVNSSVGGCHIEWI